MKQAMKQAVKRVMRPKRPGTRAQAVLIWAAVLTLAACSSDVNFSPTEPQWNPGGVPGNRTLAIDGTLQAADGRCFEATVLFDGVEVAGSRAFCADPAGCATLRLETLVHTGNGNHTVSFQVVRQTRKIVDYLAEGTVVVSRDGVALGGARLPLGPIQASLDSGGAVTFDFQLSD